MFPNGAYVKGGFTRIKTADRREFKPVADTGVVLGGLRLCSGRLFCFRSCVCCFFLSLLNLVPSLP